MSKYKVVSLGYPNQIGIGIPECGWGNGYVAVGKDHPLYGVEYYDGVEDKINIHGGITYSDYGDSMFAGNLFNDMWVFGFDTKHLGDNEQNCSREYVLKETQNLEDQLANWEN